MTKRLLVSNKLSNYITKQKKLINKNNTTMPLANTSYFTAFDFFWEGYKTMVFSLENC